MTKNDLRAQGRVILAHGEVMGHAHEVICDELAALGLPAAQFFEEPDGRRVLLIDRPCLLTHQEHAPIALDPTRPEQYRQGDVLLCPLGPGAWEVRRQVEWQPAGSRQVAD